MLTLFRPLGHWAIQRCVAPHVTFPLDRLDVIILNVFALIQVVEILRESFVWRKIDLVRSEKGCHVKTSTLTKSIKTCTLSG